MEKNHLQSFRSAPSTLHSQNQNPHFSQALSPPSQACLPTDPQQQKQAHLFLPTISESEFNSHFYRLRADLLTGTPINELMRAKLRVWLYEEGSRLNLSRTVCSLTTTLIDLFFAKGGYVSVDDFHSLGLACLLTANKLTDNCDIPISNEVFPREEINKWEQILCFKLGFRLHPITSVGLLDGFLYAWNLFSKQHCLWCYQGCGNIPKKYNTLSAKKIYETVDFLHLFLKAYDFPKGLIEWQVVQMILEKDHQSLEKAPISIEDEVVISFWDNPEEVSYRHEPFEKILPLFEMFLQQAYPWIIGFTESQKRAACLWISQIMSQGFELSSKSDCQMHVQSVSQSWFAIMKRIVRPKHFKNHRKSSSDTTV